MIALAQVPQYLLFTDSTDEGGPFDDRLHGQWRFLLESLVSDEKIEASDEEPGITGERLELLAVVRGLESLDQPSRVMLVTPSRYVNRGIRFGLESWRDSNWQWEAYGRLSMIENHDLWQRIDRAMQIHQVECRRWRLDRSREDADDNDSNETQGEFFPSLPFDSSAERSSRFDFNEDDTDCSVAETMRDMAVATC